MIPIGITWSERVKYRIFSLEIIFVIKTFREPYAFGPNNTRDKVKIKYVV